MKNFLNKTLFLVLWVSLLSASIAFASSIIASEVGDTSSDSTWLATIRLVRYRARLTNTGVMYAIRYE